MAGPSWPTQLQCILLFLAAACLTSHLVPFLIHNLPQVGNKAKIEKEYGELEGRLTQLHSERDQLQGRVDVIRDRVGWLFGLRLVVCGCGRFSAMGVGWVGAWLGVRAVRRACSCCRCVCLQ